MGDALSKVQSGQPLRIPAAAYNAFVDVARLHQQNQTELAGAGRPAARNPNLVLVRNDSGADVGRFGVLAISDSVFAPTDAEFKNRVVFAGVTPTASPHGRFVITAEPIKVGAIGAAFGAGVCPVQIDVTDDEHSQADTALSTTEHLESRHGGAAAILWRPGGTGLQWAIVRLAALEVIYDELTIDDQYTDGRVVEVGLVWKLGGGRTIIPELQEHYDQLVDPTIQDGDKVKVSLSYDGTAERIVPNVDDSGIPDEVVISGLKDASEYQETDPANRLVLVEWDQVGDPPEHDERLRLHVDDTAVADAIAGNAPDAAIAMASVTLSSSAVQQCTLGGDTISVYSLNGHAWDAFGHFGVGDEVVVWELPAPVAGCDFVGTPLDFYRDTFHEFKCIGRAYSGLGTVDLTVEFNISTANEYSYISNVRTYDNAVWSTKYSDIAVGTPVIVARVNAAAEYVGFPILGGVTGSLVVRVKATGNPPASPVRSAQRVDTAETIDVNIMGGNWSAAFPVVKTDDYFWAVRVATDPDVWYGFPSFDFRIGVGTP